MASKLGPREEIVQSYLVPEWRFRCKIWTYLAKFGPFPGQNKATVFCSRNSSDCNTHLINSFRFRIGMCMMRWNEYGKFNLSGLFLFRPTVL